MNKRIREAVKKSWEGISNSLPLMLGTIMLVSLASLIPKSSYTFIFRGNFTDVIIGSLIGSVSAGNPINSYILGGELLNQGISLIAVTSFLVSWVTVGLIQIPAESMILGKRFALLRNTLSLIFSIIVSVITVFIYNLI
jgi:uncharacterized membrane protein YraQ (UPF0718 family)